MRILAGGPARETDSEMFRLHVEGLEAQHATDWQLTVSHEHVPDDDGPRWHHEKIERVAKVRQEFLVDGGGLRRPPRDWMSPDGGSDYDALFLVDTDVILGPGVLERMWAVDADVVYACFWTEADWGQPVGPVAPNVWRCHPYSFDKPTWEALVPQCPCGSSKWVSRATGERTENPSGSVCRACESQPRINEVEVYGGGACTLIRGRGFESRYWPLLEGIRWSGSMWGGEDRSYNLGLETRGIAQIAVTGLPIVHLHHDHQQTPEAVERAREEVGL